MTVSSLPRCCYVLTHVTAKIIAARLIEQTLDWARRHADCRGAFLHVLPTNTAARALYSKMGFSYRYVLVCVFVCVVLLLCWTYLSCLLRLNRLIRRTVDNYYVIAGRQESACHYVIYMNGGRPPLRERVTSALRLFLVAVWRRCRQFAPSLGRSAKHSGDGSDGSG